MLLAKDGFKVFMRVSVLSIYIQFAELYSFKKILTKGSVLVKISRFGRLKHEIYTDIMFAGPKYYNYSFCFSSSSFYLLWCLLSS